MALDIPDKLFSFSGLSGTQRSLKDVLHVAPTQDGHMNDYTNGSTVIINSDRLILNAKKDHLFVTGKEGVTISSPKSIHIDSDDDIYIFSDKGEIYLGLPNRGGEYTPPSRQKAPTTKASPTVDYEYEPLVLGLKLANFLEDLVLAIKLITVITPAGTAGLSPQNLTNFENLQSRIPEMLSTIAFLDGVSHEKPDEGIASSAPPATSTTAGSPGSTTSGATTTSTNTNLNNTQTATTATGYGTTPSVNPDGLVKGNNLTTP